MIMASNIESSVSQILHTLGIPVATSYLKEKILSHPDYPSLLSISDTLDELGIENASLVVEKNRFRDIPVPFLAHVNSGKGQDFVLVTDTEKLLKKRPDFMNQWQGIVIVAEKPAKFNVSENQQWLDKERKAQRKILLAVTLVISVTAYALTTQFSWLMAALLVNILAGLFVSILIVEYEAGIDNPITAQLCNAGEDTDCGAVLKSKAAVIAGLTLADAGLVWFIVLYLSTIISFFTATTAHLLALFAPLIILSLLFTFFSLYYQWRIVKKRCVLCLLIIGVIWTQGFLLLPGLENIRFNQMGPVTGIFLTIFAIVAISWFLLVKPLFTKTRQIIQSNYTLRRFKNDPVVFRSLLEQQRPINVIPWKHDLQLGDPDAIIQLIIACNPHCGPCARAHTILHELAEKSLIGLVIRFALSDNKEDKRHKDAGYLLRLLSGKDSHYKRKVLHDWYVINDSKKFRQKYPLEQDFEVNEQLAMHRNWSQEEKIQHTPAIFINGCELPRQYTAEDLPSILTKMKYAVEEPIETELNPGLITVVTS
jgi:uncharacterized membrane protein